MLFPWSAICYFFLSVKENKFIGFYFKRKKKLKMLTTEKCRLIACRPVVTNSVTLQSFLFAPVYTHSLGEWWTYFSLCLTLTDWVYFSFAGIRFRDYFNRNRCHVSGMLPSCFLGLPRLNCNTLKEGIPALFRTTNIWLLHSQGTNSSLYTTDTTIWLLNSQRMLSIPF